MSTQRARAARRIDGLGTSIFTEMSALAVQYGAVNLGQGFPDFAAPDFIKQAAADAVAADRNQYAPAAGLPRLRRAIARRFADRHGRAVDPDAEVTVTAGATEGLCDALLALAEPGDEVVVLEPFYDSYVPCIRFAGALPRVVTLRPPRFDLDPDELRAAFGPRTKIVIVNTPHNPTGKVFTPDELDAVARLCVEHDVLALSDEVYGDITFDGARHVPLATRPGMWERTVTFDSIGKTFSVTGWKIGWAIAPPDLSAALRAVHQFVTFCNSTPLQDAAATALELAAHNGYYDRLRADYAARRDRLEGILAAAGLATLPVSGAYFLLADIARFGFADDVTFCRHLVTQVRVAAIPPSAFYADPRTAPRLARFCFAKQEATFAAAAERLALLGDRGDAGDGRSGG
jgi:aspartate/methionine/tyrosine aminotransferase